MGSHDCPTCCTEDSLALQGENLWGYPTFPAITGQCKMCQWEPETTSETTSETKPEAKVSEMKSEAKVSEMKSEVEVSEETRTPSFRLPGEIRRKSEDSFWCFSIFLKWFPEIWELFHKKTGFSRPFVPEKVKTTYCTGCDNFRKKKKVGVNFFCETCSSFVQEMKHE